MNKINWKKRLTNKATLTALLAAIVGGIYGVCNALGVDLPKSQDGIMAIGISILTALQLLGIIVDPNTPGITDSKKEEE